MKSSQSGGGFEVGKGPGSVENLGAWPVHADGVVPAFLQRKGVHVAAVPTEGHRDRPVSVPSPGDAVDAVSVEVVLVKEPVGAVDGDGPECVDGDVLGGDRVPAHGKSRLPAFVVRLVLGQSAPAAGGADQVSVRIDVFLLAEHGVGAVQAL